MDLFKRGKKKIPAQTVGDKFSFVDRCSIPSSVENRMYEALCETVPVIDAAIGKLVRLCGSFKVSCSDKTAEKMLKAFLKEVPCGAVNRGINAFISSTLERMLIYGTAVDELVFDGDGRLRMLYAADLKNIELREGAPATPEIYKLSSAGRERIMHPERIVVTALSPPPGSVYGVSLLRGLPFLSGVFMSIVNSVGVNFERLGNLRFAVTYRPTDGDCGQSRAEEIADAWSEAMSDRGAVRDFVAVGDVDIKVIGADSAMPDIEIPVRTILEQIVAKTGLPPFLLGFSWSSTERMSSQQADILTSELEFYRGLIEPLILKICRAFLRGEGLCCDVEIDWECISLQDELDISKARLYNAQAAKAEFETKGKCYEQ